MKKVKNLQPKKIKKQKKLEIVDENGDLVETKWEEYFEYIFEDVKNSSGFKITSLAKKWKENTRKNE